MKKILGVIFLSLLLSGCGDFYKGNKYLAQAGVSQNAGQHGWSNISLKDAENNAMAACEVFKNRKLGFGLDKNKTCRVIGSYINPNHPGTQNEIAVIKQKKSSRNSCSKKTS